MTEIILVRAVQTCRACPSQWDAWDLDGRYWYLRYRFGRGGIGRGYGHDDERLSFEAQPGEPDGEISLEGFCERIGVTYAPGYAGKVLVFEAPPPLPGGEPLVEPPVIVPLDELPPARLLSGP